MKKILATTFATAAIALGAMAQGSLAGLDAANIYSVTGFGNEASGANPYSGALTVTVWFSTTATSGNADTINNLNGVSSTSAIADLSTFGFTDVGLVSQSYASSVGASTGTGGGSANPISGFQDPIYLSSAFAASTAGTFAFYFTDGAGDASVLAFSGGNYGQNQADPPATAYNSAVNSQLENYVGPNYLDLTPVPEPATLAFAGLGGLSLLLFRRRK